jgi:hypothetical protein
MSPVMLTTTSTSAFSSARKVSAAVATNGRAVLEPSAVIVASSPPPPQPPAAAATARAARKNRSLCGRRLMYAVYFRTRPSGRFEPPGARENMPMRFRRRARLDPGQVTDVRGRGMRPGGIALGGGGLGGAALIVYLLFALLSGGGGELGQLAPLEDEQVGLGDTPGEVSEACRTGEDANERQDCRIVGVVNSVQKFWDGVFARARSRGGRAACCAPDCGAAA